MSIEEINIEDRLLMLMPLHQTSPNSCIFCAKGDDCMVCGRAESTISLWIKEKTKR